jgi:hypothetical protein
MSPPPSVRRSHRRALANPEPESGPTPRCAESPNPKTASTCEPARQSERGPGAPASAEPGSGAEPQPIKDPPQKDDKPNSVPGFPPKGGSPSDDHSSSPAITGGIKQPTRRLRTGRPITPPYLVLLRAGFSLPFTLRQTRCALTAPFHPYSPSPLRAKAGGIFSVPLSFRSP